MAARAAMIRAAQSEPGIPILFADFDADPWVLNAENGTIDLRTGKLKPHSRTDLITKSTGVKYNPAARSLKFGTALSMTQPAATLS